MKKTNYINESIEVHTSTDGEKWNRVGNPFAHDGTGPKDAASFAKQQSSHCRHVRVVTVKKYVEIIKTLENKHIKSAQEIAALLAAGKAAIAGIKGLSCNEGFLIGFGSGTISHGPTRVTVSFNANEVLGKIPANIHDDPVRKLLRKEWNEKAVTECRSALEQAQEKLKAAGIWTAMNDHEIELTKIGACALIK